MKHRKKIIHTEPRCLLSIQDNPKGVYLLLDEMGLMESELPGVAWKLRRRVDSITPNNSDGLFFYFEAVTE